MNSPLVQIAESVRGAASRPKLDLEAVRAKLAEARGKRFWRSLEEIAETPEFLAWLDDEFPSRAQDFRNAASRRDVLRLMGGALALAGLTGCTKQPPEYIVPYVRQPEDVIPGKPLYFATAMPFRGGAVGLVVESHEGRPTKIEGNPQHPASLGRTLAWQQAATLDLYDPDRSQAVLFRGRISSWGKFLGAAAELRERAGSGEGIYFLSEPLHSPTLIAQRQALVNRLPAIRWFEYDAVGQEAAAGARLAFGEPVNTVYLFERADVILSLDADFLGSMAGSIPYARGFISRRRAEADRSRINRLYVVEPAPTITGDKADHRLAVKASEVEGIARALASQLGVPAGGAPGLRPELEHFARVVAKDLQAHRSACVVVAGEQQPAIVHALAHAINQALGNGGATVLYSERADAAAPVDPQPLRTLAAEMNAGRVRTLFLLGVNPVYNAPADLQFARALEKVPLRIHHGSHQDETAALCQWHVPEAHFLESWSDAVAWDGTACIIQPLIAPIYEGKTAHEMLASLTDNPDQSAYRIVKSYWQARHGGPDFEQAWQQWLHDGVIANTSFRPKTVSVRADFAARAQASPAPAQGLEIVFRPDPCVWDGRFANNAWLQETPKPHTKLTWDNAVCLSPATAQRLGVENEDMVELRYRGRVVHAPVWTTPGQANDSASVFLGYGRRRGGRVCEGAGYDAYALRTSDQPHFGHGLEIRKIGGRRRLACTQDHSSIEGREIVLAATNAEFLANRRLFEHKHEKTSEEETLTIYPEWPYTGYKWGMAIDLNACIGCNSCVVACVAENNIAVVGKTQVLRGREMHWLRIDRYFEGDLDNPRTYFQPMLCQQCERAPCEPVCPVAATLHNDEGLSQMVYNRCVGTRYCSNNCPYKVRRFNFLLYSDWETASLEPLRNPDVTVRSRGVMEKCSFCIQRIQEAKIEAEKQERVVHDGEIQTACQQACPTEAIMFGDLNDRSSRVYRLHQNELNYSVLTELGTRPRIKYMAELRNPNPELERRS